MARGIQIICSTSLMKMATSTRQLADVRPLIDTWLASLLHVVFQYNVCIYQRALCGNIVVLCGLQVAQGTLWTGW